MGSKRLLIIVTGGLVALCLCIGATGFLALNGTGRIMARLVDDDMQAVSRAGNKIAAYEVPAGFDGGHALTLGSFSVVSYTGLDERSHIYLIQAPASLAPERAELEREAAEASGADGWTEVTVVDRRPCIVRGQETTLVVSEGVRHDGTRYRSASALFEGKGGPALVNISGLAAGWDAEMVAAFLSSLH